MALNENLYATKNPVIAGVSFLPADTTTVKDVYTAPSGGTDEAIRIMAISVCTDETAANDVIFYLNNGTTDFVFSHADVPGGSGTDGTNNAVDALNTLNCPAILRDANTNKYFDLPKGYKLRAKMRTTVAASKTCSITVLAAEYKQ